jgi:hemerythrin-like domain-containing protein
MRKRQRLLPFCASNTVISHLVRGGLLMKKRIYAVGVLGVAVALSARRRRAVQRQRATRRADVRPMFAMHAAMRRDLARLQHAVRSLKGEDRVPPPVEEGWSVLRRQIESHHRAEDDDLWPVLRARVVSTSERAEIDDMAREHARIPPALVAVGDAVSGGLDRAQAVIDLTSGVLDREQAVLDLTSRVLEHLEHEERSVLPLIEQHLTDAEWHDFLRLERSKHGPRERTEFLAWVLDEATADHAEAMLGELPAPGRFVYRRFIKPRYDARRLWSLREQPMTPGPGAALLDDPRHVGVR